MSENSIHLWEISTAGHTEVQLPDSSSLDAITRQLPGGFYSTFRTFDGRRRVLGLKAHLARLYGPAARHGISVPVPQGDLRQILAKKVAGFPNEVRVRLILGLRGELFLAIEPLWRPPESIYRMGVRTITVELLRERPRLKATAFIEVSQAERNQLAETGAFEALMIRKNRILEGITSNFFYVLDGYLGTARHDVLLGVTRRSVLQIARRAGLEVVYRPLKRVQISGISEAFLTSSSRGIVPIVQIDKDMVGRGSPGPVTRKLMNAYRKYVYHAAEQILRISDR